jgi:hypothetical protein
LERGARREALDDLPGAKIIFVGVGTSEVEVQLVGVNFGQEVSSAGEVFEVEELVFFEAMNGFYIALIGMSGGRDADMLTVAEGLRKVAFEFAAVVGLPDQVAERDAVAIEVLLDAGSENGAGGSAAFIGEGPEQHTAPDIARSVLHDGQVQPLSM